MSLSLLLGYSSWWNVHLANFTLAHRGALHGCGSNVSAKEGMQVFSGTCRFECLGVRRRHSADLPTRTRVYDTEQV